MIYKFQQPSHAMSSAAEKVSQACLSSVFTRALCEGRKVGDIPLPPDSDLERIAQASIAGASRTGKLNNKDALAILHDLELRSQGSRAPLEKGDNKETR